MSERERHITLYVLSAVVGIGGAWLWVFLPDITIHDWNGVVDFINLLKGMG